MKYDLCVNCGAWKISGFEQGDLEKIHNFVNGGSSIEELLKKYPNGFSVAPDGTISKVVMASTHLRPVAMNFPLAPFMGCYLVVEMINES